MGSNLLFRISFATSLIFACASATAADIAAPDSTTEIQCNQACLNGFVDQFFVAAIAHDPSKLRTTDDVKYTENGQALSLGEGVWATMSALRDYKLYVPDPSVEQVGFLGAIEENGVASLLALRLKVENLEVSEIEAIVARPEQGSADTYDKVESIAPIFGAPIPEARQVPRDKMIEIANSYFDAIEKDTGEVAPFTDTCVRTENGLITAGDANSPPPTNLRVNLAALNCRQQLNTKALQYISRISPRRFIAVDDEHGVIFTLPMFVHDGNLPKTETLSDGEITPTPAFALRPSTLIAGQAFKIIDGKIAQIEAIGTLIPYGSKHGWESQ